MHVLIVDDDPLAGELAAAILAEAGHDCQVVDSAAAALAHVAAEPGTELIISDHRMPGADGLELLRQVRAAGRGLPFVLLTGDAPESLADRAPGLAAVLTKDEALEASLPSLVARLAVSLDPGPAPAGS